MRPLKIGQVKLLELNQIKYDDFEKDYKKGKRLF
jgi:hypothetical protein